MGRLLLRLVLGTLFMGHAAQKLFGWFGGSGPDRAAEGFEKMGLRPGKPNVIAAGLAESVGGAMLAAGAATPLAAAMIVATMLTAIKHAGWRNGFWNADGGYEFNLVLAAAALTLADAGPGRISVDAARGRERRGSAWMLAALAGGIAGALGAEVVSGDARPLLTLVTHQGGSETGRAA
jgi:putative oxidoreductase